MFLASLSSTSGGRGRSASTKALRIIDFEVGNELAARSGITIPPHDRKPSARIHDAAALTFEARGIFLDDMVAGFQFGRIEELIEKSVMAIYSYDT